MRLFYRITFLLVMNVDVNGFQMSVTVSGFSSVYDSLDLQLAQCVLK